MRRILITGGAGFIGSALVRHCLAQPDYSICNLDKLTYAGHEESIPNPPADRYQFVHAGIEDNETVADVLRDFQPHAIINLAAESHVDRSIDRPDVFLQTNVQGTFVLLDNALRFFRRLSGDHAQDFRFIQVSTDEVYGSAAANESFDENSPHCPSSPYAASKSAADMFVRSFQLTYGLPTMIVRCSNNYGPYQMPEKLIPMMIHRIANGSTLPVYGSGKQTRQWLHVSDTCRGIQQVLKLGAVGSAYNLGGHQECTNLKLIHTLCDLIDPILGFDNSRCNVRHVADRPAHDHRYSMNCTRAHRDLQWKPLVAFEDGLRRTVQWYLNPNAWLQAVADQKLWRSRQGLGPRDV